VPPQLPKRTIPRVVWKKSKVKCEHCEGYYGSKWWVENDMFCLDCSKIDVFDACFWVEKPNKDEMRT
jgi:hypothetical protein